MRKGCTNELQVCLRRCSGRQCDHEAQQMPFAPQLAPAHCAVADPLDAQAAVQDALPVTALAAVEEAALELQQQQESSGGLEPAAVQPAVLAAASAQVLPAAGDAAHQELQQQRPLSSDGPASAVAQQAVPAEASAAVLPAAEDSSSHDREVSAAPEPAQALSLELLDPPEEPGFTSVAGPMSHAAVAEPATPEPVHTMAAASSGLHGPQGVAALSAAAWTLAQRAAMPEPVQALTAASAELARPPTLEHSSSTAARLLEQLAAVAEPPTPDPEQAPPTMSPPKLSPRSLEQDFAAASLDPEGSAGTQECMVAAADVDAADQQTLDTAALPPAEAAAHAEQQDLCEPLLEDAGQTSNPVPVSSGMAGSNAASQPGRQPTTRSSGSGELFVVPVLPAAAAEAEESVESVHLRPSAAAATPVVEGSVSTKADYHVVCTLAARRRLERRLAKHAVRQAEETEDGPPRASDAGRHLLLWTSRQQNATLCPKC